MAQVPARRSDDVSAEPTAKSRTFGPMVKRYLANSIGLTMQTRIHLAARRTTRIRKP